MTLDNYLAEAGALAGLTGILAGFAMSAVIQLLTSSDKNRVTTATIVVFAAAAVMFLFPLITSVLSFSAAAELNKIPADLDVPNQVGLLIMFAAIYVFIAGIGLSGWIRSKIAGMLTTFFALVSMCLVSYALDAVFSVFL